MKNKIKLIDRLKSWLVTLGIASVFGLAALGVNVVNSYQKASAYDYSSNGVLTFNTYDNVTTHEFNEYDIGILYSYLLSNYSDNSLSVSFELWFDDTENTYADTFIFNNESLIHYSAGYFDFLVFDESSDDGEILTLSISASTINSLLGVADETYQVVTLYSSPSFEGYQGLRNYVLSYNVSQESGNFVTALTSFMSLIGGGIVDLAQTIGAGVVSFASGLFLDSGHLSILGGIIGIFAGIALAVGITSKVYAWVSTLGN